MMQKEKKRVPKLRFPGFEGEWEKRKIGSLGDFNGGGTPDSGNKDFWDGHIAWISSSDISDDSIHQINKTRFITLEAIKQSATKVITKGSVLMVSRVGIGKFAVADEDLCTSQDFTNLTTKENSYFIAYYFKARENHFIRLSQGTSIKGFTTKDIKAAKFPIPTIEEQQKIASFLTSIDTRIQQLEKKKTLLDQYKKGVMQKIFSQEIRFKTDSGEEFGEWEEKRLGDIGVFKSGIGFSNSEQGGKDGVPFYKVSDMNLIGNEDKMNSSNNYVTQTQISELKYKVIKEHSIIFAKVGAAIFLERKRLANNFLIDNNMMSFTPRFNIDFCKYLFHTLRLSKYAQVGALPSYNASDLRIIKVEISTSLEEQTKIAHFLSALDRKIAVTNEQIEQTKEWKKGLLQRMFV